MASQQQKIEHLDHHLRYEVLMLCHAHSRMNSPGYPLDWNAYYEAFAVHARVLLDFLENKSDGRNFRKSDFSGTFKAETDQEIQRIVRQEMNCQVLHFGKSRKSEPSGKVDLEKVNRVHKWVIDNFSRFLAELDNDLRGHWDPDRANPEKFHERYTNASKLLSLGKQNQTASSGDLRADPGSS
jgi:hypothetical protein